MRVSLLTNSPGELWGWARPVVAELRKRGHSVSLWLLPCQFASGYERMAASRLGVDKLEGCGAWKSGMLMSGLRTWGALSREKTDGVLQLGGDLLFGRRLAKSAKASLLCYAYGFQKGMERAQVFTAYPGMAADMSAKIGARTKAGARSHASRSHASQSHASQSFERRARAVGDLVKDALALEKEPFKWNDDRGGGADGARLLLFPGSRPAIRRLALPWLEEVVRRLQDIVPTVQVGTLFSPFVPESEFPIWRDAGLNPMRGGAGTAMKSADYALTQPGTNNLEMMHCGLPALIVAPMEFLKVVPVGGLGGFLSGVPLLGPRLKEWGIRRKLSRYGDFISWPNRIANRAVMDELTGDVTPEDAARHIARAMRDKEKLRRVRGELLALSGDGGAASRLCDALEREAGGGQTVMDRTVTDNISPARKL
jgi:lipid-A-disaccharide synthase